MNITHWVKTSFIVFLLSICISVLAHDDVSHKANFKGNPRAVEAVDFTIQNVNRVVTAGYPVSFGVYAFSRREQTKKLLLENKEGRQQKCLKANFLAFDVNDEFAFDINEDINIELLIDRSQTNSLVYGFDQHGSEKANGLIELAPLSSTKSNLVWVKAVFKNARFVNRGISGTDFVLTTNETMLYESNLSEDSKTTFVLCDVKISRNTVNKVVPEKLDKIQVNFNFIDEKGGTPVRLGIYNSIGSAVLLEKTGLLLPFFEDYEQHHSLPAFFPPYQYWPNDNRYYYYADQQLSLELPPDTYTLVATKGPEYKITIKKFTITPEEQGVNYKVFMDRWLNLPNLGWYSGDVHIHIERSEKDNINLQKIFTAEDLHFSNLLEMSTIETDHFKQYSFGKMGTYTQGLFSIIPGIEGPRTAYRGHAIALNVKEAFTNENSFFLYNKYFDFYRKQKAVIGYAHVGSKEFNASLGLALDMPFGLIDFVEILQSQRLRTEFWYEFLNLGFKLAPAAGSDFPYFEQPGAVRSYVKLPNSDHNKITNTDEWFKALKWGNTFVSNLPFINLTINDQPIGSRLTIEKNSVLKIEAHVAINTDYDKLAQLELIQCGQVIKTITAPEHGSETLSFTHTMSNTNSGWLSLRAKGIDYALAHTGAIYLEDKSKNSMCKEQAPEIIELMQSRLLTLKNAKLDINKELEYWETDNLESALSTQISLLNEQIIQANEFYKKMKSDLSLSNKN